MPFSQFIEEISEAALVKIVHHHAEEVRHDVSDGNESLQVRFMKLIIIPFSRMYVHEGSVNNLQHQF